MGGEGGLKGDVEDTNRDKIEMNYASKRSHISYKIFILFGL